MVAQAIRAPLPLPRVARGLSVLSYNVLLPNSLDGWWTYKMYAPGTLNDPSQASWPARSALLRECITAADADVVCLQEVAAGSFEADWAFMAELGYGGVELFKKGRFRPATFWRPAAVSLVSSAHRDRCIVTAFTLAPAAAGRADVTVVNCHLQAGPEGSRRLRQMHDAVDAAVKAAKRAGVSDPATAALIICGDLNGGESSAAVRLLEDGAVDSGYMEDGETVTTKVKQLSLPPLADAAAQPTTRAPPPTLVVAELISVLVRSGTNQGRAAELSAVAEAALQRAFSTLSGGKPSLDAADVARWLGTINLAVGRGSEFRAAVLEMGGGAAVAAAAATAADGGGDGDDDDGDGAAAAAARPTIPAEGQLSWEGFRRVYEAELRAGKYWGVAWDLHALGQPVGADAGVFTARYDRIYTSRALEVVAVLDAVSEVPCPNCEQPSDHLPVGVTVRLLE